ncbi:hypothetical protein B0H14DRAFT_2581828 [Mycena olivaceomarginata]|nr:hypothetical protein B0H14DRAFT_2581828 [Mycena olivaceomarginata]
MQVCSSSGAFDLWDGCVRSSWSAILPFLVMITFCVASLRIPWPSPLQKLFTALKAPFRTFITLHEAEAVDLQSAGEMAADSEIRVPQATPFGRSLVFTFAGVLQSLAWIASGVFYFVATHQAEAWHFAQFLLIAVSWLYTAVRPIASPFATAPYDLFVIYLLHLAGGVFAARWTSLRLCGRGNAVAFDAYPSGPVRQFSHRPGAAIFHGQDANGFPLCTGEEGGYSDPKTKISQGQSVSPEDYTRLWGWITFSWVYPMIKRGKHETLNEKDVWSLSPTMQSRPLFIKFQSIRLDFVGTILSIFFAYAGPFFLKRILDSINQADPSPRETGTAYIYAGLMLLCSVLKVLSDIFPPDLRLLNHCYRPNVTFSTSVRSELMAAIYDKTLKRQDFSGIVNKDNEKAAEAKKSADSADAVKVTTKADKAKAKAEEDKANDPRAGAGSSILPHLFSVLKHPSQTREKSKTSCRTTTDDIAFIVSTIYFLTGAPFELAIGSFFLYQLLGWSAFAGFAVFFACWPLNSYVTNRGYTLHKGVTKAKDKRMAVLDELISSLKARERSNSSSFLHGNNAGLTGLWLHGTKSCDGCSKVFPQLSSFSSIWNLNPPSDYINTILFTGLWGFAPISLSLVSFFTYVWLGNELTVGTAFTLCPTYIVSIIQARVALNRIAVYLDEDEVTSQVSSLKQDPSDSAPSNAQNEGLGLENASFEWNKVEDEKAPRTGESTRTARAICVLEFDQQNHLSVITGPTASGKTALLMALMGEMTLLPGGRLIMVKNNTVDEHGNTRGIAYAAQSPWLRHQSIRDNILFGSPMDEARYNDTIQCCALKPDLDMLEDGDATEIGVKGVSLSGGQKARYTQERRLTLVQDSHTSRFLYEKCLQGPLLANRTVILVTHHVELVLPGAHYVVRMLDGRIDTQGTAEELRAKGVLDEIAHEAAVEVQKEEAAVAAEAPEALEQTEAKKPRKLVEDEHRGGGTSYYIWGLLAFLIVAQQLRAVSEKIWIKIWTEAYTTSFAVLIFKPFGSGGNEILLTDNLPYTDVYFKQSGASTLESRFPNASERPMFYVGVYAVLGMVWCHSPVDIRYAPIHRRFEGLPNSLQAVNAALAGFFASILTVIAVFPPFLLPASIIGYLYRYLAIGYLNAGRDLRRMESNTRSPIFSDFGELLTGIVTHSPLRKLHEQRALPDRRNEQILDDEPLASGQLRPPGQYPLFAITFLHDDAGLAGLAITSALTFSQSVYWACRFWTGLELDLNSVERIVEYMDLPQEPPAIIESHRPPAYWPSSVANTALVAVEDLNVKYAPDLPSVLQDVSFELKAGERVGLVGRTGSGKSTLAMSLLRFVDPSSGRILIDGIDISKIGVHGDYEDSACLDVLLRVNLIKQSDIDSQTTSRVESVAASPLGSRVASVHGDDASDSFSALTNVETKMKLSLDTQVSAGGTNFSQGQRQLIAMARALLRRSSIVVMDEATSSVDFETDSKIQAAIRAEFTDSLLITVAHRLRTIIDYDRLLVLDKGKVAEFDTPSRLIQKEDGIFRNMCLKSGSFGELEAAAKAKDAVV